MDWKEISRRLGPSLAGRALKHDIDGTFVTANYTLLREHGVMGALVPTELGGGGATVAEMAQLLRELARHCGSTALALSMHQHLVAVAAWSWRRKGDGEALLRRVASEQIVLVSTGATDWVDSNGSMRPVDGGYRVTARKAFASGCPAASLMISSARCGNEVLHFALPLDAPGVRVGHDWDALGMRGTGSHTIELEDVFVPEEAVRLRRPHDQWHPAWNVVLTLAPPLYMAPYVGIAEAACELGRSAARLRPDDPHTAPCLGEMQTELEAARLAWQGLLDNALVEPSIETANCALMRKTLVARSAKTTTQLAMEACGGRGYFRGFAMERLFRDVQASGYHPLPPRRQALFSGRVALGQDPIRGERQPEPGTPPAPRAG